MCKYLRTALGCNGLAIGATVEIGANTDSSGDDGLLSPEECVAEAGCDVESELRYIRSGHEKRTTGANLTPRPPGGRLVTGHGYTAGPGGF